MKLHIYGLAALSAACLLGAPPAAGQELLSAQRSEIQSLPPVPGKKLDHHGIVINPTPQSMRTDASGRLNVASGMKKKLPKALDGDAAFIGESASGPRLTVAIDRRRAARAAKDVAGAYTLSVGPKGIAITGRDEAGAFYGLQTLRQILESPACAEGFIPYMEIADYPDLPNRGVVEGFYGPPWSHDVRLSLIDFYGRHKMNTYVYGPKDDPYHRSPNWRDPYPEAEAARIRELVEACDRNHVEFVWAIHPGGDIQWDETDYQNMVRKFEHMYDLGVRHFAIFFDDISGEGTNPQKQIDLLNRLTDEFVRRKPGVGPLTVCPTDYTELWANPTPQGSLVAYGNSLYPEIKVFWTGKVVCADLTRETLEFVNPRIKRPAYFWWNFPVTDYAREVVMQGPTYGVDTTLTASDVAGVLSNPMEHGEASKLALYGVADYGWNTSDFNPIDNWERGLVELMPDAADAYRTFAIHTADTQTGYRRDESWETKTFRLADWTDADADALEAEFARIEAVPQRLRLGATNPGLLKELDPWIEEFGKLGARGRKAIELGRLSRRGIDDATFWALYSDNLMTPEQTAAFAAHKLGQLKLQPFYENMMADLGTPFLRRLSGSTPTDYAGIGTYKNSAQAISRLMLDGDTTTYYWSRAGQKPGDWIGLDLGELRDVDAVSVLQGRGTEGDLDYYEFAQIEASADGKTWTPLGGVAQDTMEIAWTGAPVKARYVRLRRHDSKRTNYASVREFSVNPVSEARLGFSVEGDAPDALRAFDNSLLTSTRTNSLAFGVKEGTKGFTILARQPQSKVSVRQYGADGNLISQSAIVGPYAEIAVAAPGVSRVEIAGPIEIFEIVPRR